MLISCSGLDLIACRILVLISIQLVMVSLFCFVTLLCRRSLQSLHLIIRFLSISEQRHLKVEDAAGRAIYYVVPMTNRLSLLIIFCPQYGQPSPFYHQCSSHDLSACTEASLPVYQDAQCRKIPSCTSEHHPQGCFKTNFVLTAHLPGLFICRFRTS